MGPAHENFLPSKIFEKFVKKVSRGADAPTTRRSRRIFRRTMTNVSTFARAEFQGRARLRGAQHLAGTQKKFSPKIGCPHMGKQGAFSSRSKELKKTRIFDFAALPRARRRSDRRETRRNCGTVMFLPNALKFALVRGPARKSVARARKKPKIAKQH